MLIALVSSAKDLAVTGQDIVRLFFPDGEIALEPCDDCALTIIVSAGRSGNTLTGKAVLQAAGSEFSEEAATDVVPFAGDERNQQKRLVKLAVYRVLTRYTGSKAGPWGILTGIRPTKIVHRLLDLHWAQAEIMEYLTGAYDMSPEKAGMLLEIAARQRRYLLSEEQAAKTVSVYIGIPFCPSRCAYCSFPSCSVEGRGAGLVAPFLQALTKEICEIGKFLRDSGRRVQTIYIGGGTPTVLNASQLNEVLDCIGLFLKDNETGEITLEAGRPDTITEDKLKAAIIAGVTRLSINPQTMNLRTLRTIGRHHTPHQIAEAVGLARTIGFKNINMDIIIGLPGEETGDVLHTLEELAGLSPENLTVHTLAVKRASRIKESGSDFRLPDSETVEEMLKITAEAAAQMKMHPYYLYRQKRMVGPLENTGYAKEGCDCIYNIQIIEERQTVLGLGGGAGSKYVEPGTWHLTSHYNPKDPQNYMERINELIAKKVTVLTEKWK